MNRIILIAGALLAFQACNPVGTKQKGNEISPIPRNIVLMIGDGMGPTQVSAAIIANGNRLNIERCAYAGYSKTSSADNLITDSAAGGAAIATGNKTNNGVIGLDAQGSRVLSILEVAEQNGKRTGLIATSSITHATPASFYAHQPSRKMDEEIAMDLVSSDVDLFMGGGRKFFAKRADSLNLIDSLIARNYHIAKDVKDIPASSSKVGLFIAKGQPVAVTEGRGAFLPEGTESALNYLKDSDTGFFLMIEGSQIDWGGHSNDMEHVLAEMKDFDDAIGKVLDFAERDGNTLVVITADHETGGLTILGGNRDGSELQGNFSSKNHTPTMVPVFAYGPGGELFTGIMENTDIFNRMLKAWNVQAANSQIAKN